MGNITLCNSGFGYTVRVQADSLILHWMLLVTDATYVKRGKIMRWANESFSY